MPFFLDEISRRTKTDPEGFVRECDMQFEKKIRHAAGRIMDNMQNSPIVLISGPSGSGKTTTSKKIEEVLKERGIMTYALAMDNYFRTIDESSPRNADGTPDLESPYCVDLDLLNRHFNDLSEGREIEVPSYNFAKQRRKEEPSGRIRLGKNDIVIVEGIHALNDMITEAHPQAMKLYISARSNVENANGEVVFKGTWMRLLRRTVRDMLFRGASPEYTFGLWANVRRGEKMYISPFKDKATLKLDSSFPCEIGIMKTYAKELFQNIPVNTPRYEELKSIPQILGLFEEIDPTFLAPESLLREFIGGGKYEY